MGQQTVLGGGFKVDERAVRVIVLRGGFRDSERAVG